MENLVGKQIRYKGTQDMKTIKKIENNRVYFTDNGSVEMGRMVELFEEVQMSKPNPETFFDSQMSSNFGSLIHQIEQFQQDPMAFKQQNSNNLPPLSANGEDLSGISPETLRNYEESQRMVKQRAMEAEEARKNDPWLKAQIQNGDMGEVRRVESNHDEELERVKRVNGGEKLPPIQNNTQKSNNSQESTSNSSLPKMKKTFKIKLKLELNEMIPKIDDIRAVESLFDISLIDDIGKEIADKYLNDRELFTNMIISELEQIIKPKKKTKKAVVKKMIPKINEA